jgi:hypothetical protein
VQVTPSESVVIGASTFPKTSTLLTSAADSLGLRTSTSFSGGIDLVGSGTGNFGVYVSPFSPHPTRELKPA